MPPLRGEEGEACENGIGQNGQAQGPGATEPVADPSEKTAAKGPANQKSGLNPGTLFLDKRVGSVAGGQSQQDSHKGGGHKGEQMQLHAIEKPAQPGRNT